MKLLELGPVAAVLETCLRSISRFRLFRPVEHPLKFSPQSRLGVQKIRTTMRREEKTDIIYHHELFHGEKEQCE